MFDLEAYLARIGLSGHPSLRELHPAHATSIPFEGFDAHMGIAPALGSAELAAKLVGRRRGGYCYEQNLLLKAALQALGYQVEPYLARVMIGLAPGAVRPPTHLLLRVSGGPDGDEAEPGGLAGGAWHADVGFGSGTLLEPLPWGPGAEHEQAGWSFRVLERGPQWVLQTLEAGDWIDVYGFLPVPVPHVDIEMSNWWTATHPESSFVTGFLATRHWPDGRRLILSDWGELTMIERTAAETVRTPLRREQVPGLLAERLDLPGFELDAAGRITRPRG
ncbi:MAG TPA: arylamine N-acetyltransferase [Solirubrobacteraceae bacterium]|nr:arylamine N-acetyltransferase [Solirubrobacteraceae bacterium]